MLPRFLLTVSLFLLPITLAAAEKLDAHGDPLPEGALARLGTLRFRHGNSVAGLAFSPDGKKLASIGDDQSLRVWDAVTGKELQSFPISSHPGGLAFTADGKFLATTSGHGTTIWDLQTGKTAHESSGWFLGFSSDGKLALIAASTRRPAEDVVVWDVAAGKERCKFTGHSKGVFKAVFSKDGKTAASVGPTQTCVWNTDDAKKPLVLDGPPEKAGAECDVALSPDGKLVAQVDRMTVRLWDTATGKAGPALEVGHLKQGGSRQVLFSPDGKTLLTESYSDHVHLWDAATGKHRAHIEGYFPRLVGDGSLVAVVFNSTMRLHDARTGELKVEMENKGESMYYHAFSADGKVLAAAAGAGIRFWDAETGKEKSGDPSGRGVKAVGVLADGKTYATTHYFDDKVTLWDADGKVIRREPRQPYAPDGVIFLPDPKASYPWPKDAAGTGPRRVRGNAAAVVVSPDGKRLAYATTNPYAGDRALREGPTEAVLWDLVAGKALHAVSKNGHGFLSIAMAGRKVLALESASFPSSKTTLTLWDVVGGKQIREIAGWSGWLTPDGRGVVVLGRDNKLRLIEVATGDEALAFPEGIGTRAGVAFSPDGRLLATGGEEGAVRLWSLATGKPVAERKGHRGLVLCLAFSPDGKTLISGSSDTTALVWDVSGLATKALPEAKEPTAKEMDALWEDLGGDPTKAHTAVWAVAAGGEKAASLLAKKVPPARDDDLKAIRKLITDLDSDDFTTRQAAAKELTTLGAEAEAAMRHALEDRPSAEVRKQIEGILGKGESTLSVEVVRRLRAVQALEQNGSKAAREALAALAKGSPWSILTEAAREALGRMEPVAKGPDRKGAAAPIAKPLVVSVGQTIRLQLTSKKPIKTAINNREDVVRVTPMPDDPTTVLVTGLNPGVARVTLIAADGEEEVFASGKR